MIVWLNGCYGVGKSQVASILRSRMAHAHVYDPEQVGYFLWDQFPEGMRRTSDFQDMDIWRSINFDILRHLARHFEGDVIVPMTLVHPGYFAEIVGRLRACGVEVRHFILLASKDVILQRLSRRGEKRGCWAERQIDRCLAAFEAGLEGVRIDTSQRSADQVAQQVLRHMQP